VRCPVFLQYGSEDTSVPVAASIESIERAFSHSGVRPTIRVYPGLEHMLNVVPDDITGLAPEAAMYGFHRFRFGPGTSQDLTDWLRHTVRAQ
jgi:dienelactone hydrolase